MKKFVNDPANFVAEMLEGVYLANPKMLRYVPQFNIIHRADRPAKDKVSIIQGSGSGHEPAHVMTVGPGMLDVEIGQQQVPVHRQARAEHDAGDLDHHEDPRDLRRPLSDARIAPPATAALLREWWPRDISAQSLEPSTITAVDRRSRVNVDSNIGERFVGRPELAD